MQLAENLDGQLTRMGEDLKEIISHLNSAARAEDSRDPVTQMGKVANIKWCKLRNCLVRSVSLLNGRYPHLTSACKAIKAQSLRTEPVKSFVHLVQLANTSSVELFGY